MKAYFNDKINDKYPYLKSFGEQVGIHHTTLRRSMENCMNFVLTDKDHRKIERERKKSIVREEMKYKDYIIKCKAISHGNGTEKLKVFIDTFTDDLRKMTQLPLLISARDLKKTIENGKETIKKNGQIPIKSKSKMKFDMTECSLCNKSREKSESSNETCVFHDTTKIIQNRRELEYERYNVEKSDFEKECYNVENNNFKGVAAPPAAKAPLEGEVEVEGHKNKKYLVRDHDHIFDSFWFSYRRLHYLVEEKYYDICYDSVWDSMRFTGVNKGYFQGQTTKFDPIDSNEVTEALFGRMVTEKEEKVENKWPLDKDKFLAKFNADEKQNLLREGWQKENKATSSPATTATAATKLYPKVMEKMVDHKVMLERKLAAYEYAMNDHVGGSRSYRKSDNDKNTIDASGKGSSGLHALAAAASQRASDFIPATAKKNTSDTSSGVHTLTLAAAASQRASASIPATTSAPTPAKKNTSDASGNGSSGAHTLAAERESASIPVQFDPHSMITTVTSCFCCCKKKAELKASSHCAPKIMKGYSTTWDGYSTTWDGENLSKIKFFFAFINTPKHIGDISRETGLEPKKCVSYYYNTVILLRLYDVMAELIEHWEEDHDALKPGIQQHYYTNRNMTKDELNDAKKMKKKVTPSYYHKHVWLFSPKKEKTLTTIRATARALYNIGAIAWSSATLKYELTSCFRQYMSWMTGRNKGKKTCAILKRQREAMVIRELECMNKKSIFTKPPAPTKSSPVADSESTTSIKEVTTKPPALPTKPSHTKKRATVVASTSTKPPASPKRSKTVSSGGSLDLSIAQRVRWRRNPSVKSSSNDPIEVDDDAVITTDDIQKDQVLKDSWDVGLIEKITKEYLVKHDSIEVLPQEFGEHTYQTMRLRQKYETLSGKDAILIPFVSQGHWVLYVVWMANNIIPR